jgi:type II restriction enzyme
MESSQAESEPSFTHSQIQTLLGAIGNRKNCHVWIPTSDREALDWSLSDKIQMPPSLPPQFRDVEPYLSQIDVVWLEKGSNKVRALYEVEHSTPIYSGLLRFNDIFLTTNTPVERFAVVSNEKRRALFVQQINRPTFKKSGLVEVCTFFEYFNVYRWYQRLLEPQPGKSD